MSNRSFYTLLLTALMGMFLFVTYYAVQQVQVYRSTAATNCVPGGATCGNLGRGGCCSPYTCQNKDSKGNGTCLLPAKNTPTVTPKSGGSCVPGGATCGNVGVGGCCPPYTCQNKDSKGNGTCLLPAGSGSTPTATPTTAPTSCSEITNRTECNAFGGCYWFAAGYCGLSCDSYSDEASCVAGGCGWDSYNQCCGGNCGVGGGGDEDSGGGSGGSDESGGSETTPTGTGATGETASVTLNLTLSFQGITQLPSSGETSMDVLVTLAGGPSNQDISSTGTFTADSSGRWSGQVPFNGVTTGSGYKVLVKGPKHIQKKICDAAPSETAPGTYSCGDGNITINSGANTFDFSGIRLLVGDLAPQDGIIDSYDIALVRNSFCTTSNPNVCRDANTVSKADLNLDGIIDTQDYSLLISSLSVKYDEKK